MSNLYIHFTKAEHAKSIVAEMALRISTVIVDAVYAVAVGGEFVPSVQYGGGEGVIGEAGREVAVLFAAGYGPEIICPEEVVWHRTDSLPLTEALIITVEEAIALLDGSANIPEDGIYHNLSCNCAGCACHRATFDTLFAA